MKLILLILTFSIASCTPSYDHEIKRYRGNFRYYADIAEFFDCKTQEMHYFGDEGIVDELIEAYKKLNLKAKDDVYMRLEGFYQEEEQIDGVDPIDVFVPTKIIEIDTTRSCQRHYKGGY